jgi:hypothetical protein
MRWAPEPLWFEFLRRLVRQNHERFLCAPLAAAVAGENNIDVGCRALVAMSDEGVSAYQQVVNAVGVQRTQAPCPSISPELRPDRRYSRRTGFASRRHRLWVTGGNSGNESAIATITCVRMRDRLCG